ncbi:hypothetical protein BV22DRAFT_1101434 [Leucogyrophana mollusca]|uniref:Uncharacterized protein n=1 Tax=Leucogyrophana mollusca TaxID=85980 RepID=A0ACB8BZY2_9AGAM|nr:hypothetical protein BV22DRAFT_1101434 [Leucogyrophana mollusca]
MSLFSTIISNSTTSRPHQPLIILQSSSAQTCLPVLRKTVSSTRPSQTLLFSFLYPPSTLIDGMPSPKLKIFDYTSRVPGYGDSWSDPRDEILAAVQSAPPGSLNVVLDSVDTLASDLSSTPQTYKFIRTLLDAILARPQPSVLTLHLLSCPILPILTQTTLSPTLTHLIAHPPSLLTHLATAYLTLPPPTGPPEKFWSVFIPVAERVQESERLVFGPEGDGSSAGAWVESTAGKAGTREFVVEVLVRGGGGEGRKRGIERSLEGWKGSGPCELVAMDSLKSIWSRKRATESVPDPTQSVSFNLSLTPSQEKSRAQVPLPYAHEGSMNL